MVADKYLSVWKQYKNMSKIHVHKVKNLYSASLTKMFTEEPFYIQSADERNLEIC